MPNVLLRVALVELVKFDYESTLDRLPRATDGINVHQRWRIPKLRRIYPCVPRIPSLLYNGELPSNNCGSFKKHPNRAHPRRRTTPPPSKALRYLRLMVKLTLSLCAQTQVQTLAWTWYFRL